jgi:hypothetical protein
MIRMCDDGRWKCENSIAEWFAPPLALMKHFDGSKQPEQNRRQPLGLPP